MIKPGELRLNNWLLGAEGQPQQVVYICETIGLKNSIGGTDKYQKDPIFSYDIKDLKYIPLSPEILEKAGFTPTLNFTVMNSHDYPIGRKRHLSIGNVGTPNEMLFLVDENEDKTLTVIVLHNYDYDGKLYLHRLQNYIQLLTGTELSINLNDNQ